MREFKGIGKTNLIIGEPSIVTVEDGTDIEYSNPVEAKERYYNEQIRMMDRAINRAIVEAGFNHYTGEHIAVDCNSGA